MNYADDRIYLSDEYALAIVVDVMAYVEAANLLRGEVIHAPMMSDLANALLMGGEIAR